MGKEKFLTKIKGKRSDKKHQTTTITFKRIMNNNVFLRGASAILEVLSQNINNCKDAIMTINSTPNISLETAKTLVHNCLFQTLASSYKLLGVLLVTLTILIIILILLIISLSKITTKKYDVKGKHVMITGGSSGIGLAVAKEYLHLGANVTILARDRYKLKQAEESLQQEEEFKNRVISISVDVGSGEKAVITAIRPAIKSFGDVDVLVNCAGTSIAGAFDELDADAFERMMSVNYFGSVYATRAILAGMKRKGAGRIVFVASQVAQVAIHGYTAYGASKWALRGLAEALQMEVKPFGILVSVCYPPDTDTPGYKTEMESKPTLTKALSDSGSVFSAESVAKDLVRLSSMGYFGISTGLDGWLLKQLHPGMTPINNIWEVVQQIVFSGIARVISVFYLVGWDMICMKRKGEAASAAATSGSTSGSSSSNSSSSSGRRRSNSGTSNSDSDKKKK